jgi:hypothetical protein
MKKLIFSMMIVLLSIGVFAQVVINPSNPTDNDDLTCNVQNGNPDLYIYRWFLNNEEKSRGNTISSSMTSPSETWMCKVFIPPTKYTKITEFGEASVTIESLTVNNQPYFTSAPATVGTVGVLYNYDANAVDPEEDELTYSLTASPAGMSIDPATGIVSWTPSTTGTYPITISVSDRISSVNQNYNLLVSSVSVIDSSTEMPDYLPIPPKP